MTWAVPGWWPLLLLALAAFRTWRLLAEDAVLDRPRDWLFNRNAERWENTGGKHGIVALVTCPWCLGAWLAIGWWLSWTAWPHWTLVAAVPAALSAVVGLVAANIDPV